MVYARPQIPPHQRATRATLFAYVLGQELGGRGGTTGSENGMSQLRVRDLACTQASHPPKTKPKEGFYTWKHLHFLHKFPNNILAGESLPCPGRPSPLQAPVHPALPWWFRRDAAGWRSEQAPMGTPAPKGRCCVNSYFINTVNCDKRAIKILVLLKLFLHLEQLYHQKMLHIALYTELAAHGDNITALLNNRYKNHRSLKTTNSFFCCHST